MGDAFERDGILPTRLPGISGPPSGCADATAVVVQENPATGERYLSAALPDDAAACNQVPLQIRFTEPVVGAKVRLADCEDVERRTEQVAPSTVSGLLAGAKSSTVERWPVWDSRERANSLPTTFPDLRSAFLLQSQLSRSVRADRRAE